jgi:hypothetical protein
MRDRLGLERFDDERHLGRVLDLEVESGPVTHRERRTFPHQRL